MTPLKITLDNTVGHGVGFGFGLILVLALISWVVRWSYHGTITPDEVRGACVVHGGVLDTHTLDWSLAQNGRLSIVCRDGFYTTR